MAPPLTSTMAMLCAGGARLRRSGRRLRLERIVHAGGSPRLRPQLDAVRAHVPCTCACTDSIGGAP
jgi:hypothetical protein